MDELTGDQIDELRRDLIDARARLEEVLEISKEGSRPVNLDEPIGRLSRMDAIQQQQMTIANRGAYERKLRQIEAALEVMDNTDKGEYGECRSCEEPIGYRRLKARPETPFCLECQDARES